MSDSGKPPMNPYLAGVFLGLVLVASYAVLGAGLGASGALARLAAALSHLVAPAHTQASAYFGAWAPHYLSYYLVFMFLGILVGGFLSAVAAGRLQPGLERGPGCPPGKRAFLALAGGVLVGFASRLAQGCTSGQALSGGALLLTGSLIFMAALFVAGFAVARFFRGQWYA